ncbi:MAG: hypothetical protein LLG24_05530 [Actinomycetia bacterium]|nr:hypothetical protein [Actinomycetes bacterium]
MSCYLLHVLETPDEEPYRDPEVKDIIGRIPQFFCTHCQPIKRLPPSAGFKCLRREAPCWKPADRICADD